MVGISVAFAVEHLPTANVPSTISLAEKNRFIFIPNLDSRSTVKANVKQFVEEFLYNPSHLQSLSAPLFTKIGENESVEDLYRKYDCHAEAQDPGIHLDEDTYTFVPHTAGRYSVKRFLKAQCPIVEWLNALSMRGKSEIDCMILGCNASQDPNEIIEYSEIPTIGDGYLWT